MPTVAQSWCPACGAELRDLHEPVCPACGEPREETVASTAQRWQCCACGRWHARSAAYTFTLDIDVTDEAALIGAAQYRAKRDGMSAQDWVSSLLKATDEGTVPEFCLRMLLDPGQSPEGTEIQDSACEARS